jgi:hypothetical protein
MYCAGSAKVRSDAFDILDLIQASDRFSIALSSRELDAHELSN